jgi:hypothetical protein
VKQWASHGCKSLGRLSSSSLTEKKGLFSKDPEVHLKRKSIQIRPHAPGQRAQTLAKRGAILRHALRTSDSQLIREGSAATLKQFFAERIFGGHSLRSFGSVTQCDVRFGRQPLMLPDIHAAYDDTSAGPARLTYRILEVVLQKICETCPIARINRTSRAVTATPGQLLDYQPGEMVDFHRPAASKDDQGCWQQR